MNPGNEFGYVGFYVLTVPEDFVLFNGSTVDRSDGSCRIVHHSEKHARHGFYVFWASI